MGSGLTVDRTLVRERLTKLATQLDESADRAFLFLLYGLKTGLGYDTLDEEDITDGGDDFEMDVVSIDDATDPDTLSVVVVAATTSESHSTTELTRLSAGLEYLLARPKNEWSKLPNEKLRERIRDFREAWGTFPGTVRVDVLFATLGDKTKLAKAFENEVTRIQQRFSGASISFTLEIWGAREIVEQVRLLEAAARSVTERLQIEYDVNRPSLIERRLEGIRALICTLPAGEVARIVQKYPAIFDRNVRKYLTRKNQVNSAIFETCTNEETAPLFWFLNNGITIICDDYKSTLNADNPSVLIESLQIVNGCQTSSAINEANLVSRLRPETTILTRIIAAADMTISDRLVVTTNTQTKITARDLKANDRVQEVFQTAFRDRFSLNFERKPNEFMNLPKEQRSTIVINERVGQAVMALVLKRPADGGRRKYKIWGEDYERVFDTGRSLEAALLAYRIVELCREWRRGYQKTVNNEAAKAVLSNGLYHVARIAAFMWRKGDDWFDVAKMQEQLTALQSNGANLDGFFKKSFRLLLSLVKKDEALAVDPPAAMKSNELEAKLTDVLHKKKALKTGKIKRVRLSSRTKK
jgi:hypothetical protein